MLALGYGPATVGAVVAIGALSSALLQLAVGWLADRIGRKPVLAAFGVLTMLGSAAYALHLPLGWLMLATALGTVGQGGGAAGGGAFGPYYPAEQALIAELAGDARRTSIFARLSLIGAIGGILGSLAAAWPELLQRRGAPPIGSYAPLFWVTAGFGVVLALVVVPIRETRPTHPKRFRAHLRLARPTRAIVARFMLTNATNGLAIGYLGPIVVLWFHARFGVGSAQIAALYTIANLATLLPYLGVTRTVRFFGGAVRMVVAMRAASCVVLAAVPFAPVFWIAGVAYVVRVVLNVMTVPVRQSYVMGVIPAHERSRAAALSNLPSRLGAMVGPATAGPMIEAGLLVLPFELAAGLQLLNAALYWTFFRHLALPEETPIETPTG